MRTFHTGGIFTGELLQQIRSPFSGKLIIPTDLKTVLYRTNHGTIVSKLQQEARITLLNWKGIKQTIFLEIGSYLYITSSIFIKEGQLISEYSKSSSIAGKRRLKPIYTPLEGEIKFENLITRTMERDERTIRVNEDDGVLWITSGKIFSLPCESKYLFPKALEIKKPIAKIKLVNNTAFGFVNLKGTQLSILNEITKDVEVSLNLSNLTKTIKNCEVKLSLIVKNYQWIDPATILGYLAIYPKMEGLIYAVRQKEVIHRKEALDEKPKSMLLKRAYYITTLLIITEKDIWKINSEQTNDFEFFKEKKAFVRSGNILNTNSKFNRSGFFLKRDGFKMIFQTASPIFLSRGTILNYQPGNFVFQKKIFATLVNYTQQTNDIVQGLPKIEELIEARRPKSKAYLAKKPGIIINSDFNFDSLIEFFEKKIVDGKLIVECELSGEIRKESKTKQYVNIIHSIGNLSKKNLYKNFFGQECLGCPFEINPIKEYNIPTSSKVLVKSGDFIDLGEPITEGEIDVHDLLNVLFHYHSVQDGVKQGTIKSLNKFRLLLVNSIQSIYQSQDVNVSSKHIEIIVRQMSSKVIITKSGDTPFFVGEILRFSIMNEIWDSFAFLNDIDINFPGYEPILMSATTSSLNKDGFLSAAGFQETKRVLAKAAIEGTTDWFRGLKECIMIGRLIPAGSSFLNYKSYLDEIYFFKKED